MYNPTGYNKKSVPLFICHEGAPTSSVHTTMQTQPNNNRGIILSSAHHSKKKQNNMNKNI
jgi:hypothetical protein